MLEPQPEQAATPEAVAAAESAAGSELHTCPSCGFDISKTVMRATNRVWKQARKGAQARVESIQDRLTVVEKLVSMMFQKAK